MLQRGQRFDDYEIIDYFEGGGMGEIYLARELSLDRLVAIKVTRPDIIRYPHTEEAKKATELFRREAGAIARLHHPYVLPLYRFGKTIINNTPIMYMVMPYCQEKSLADWQLKHGKRVLSLQEVEHIVKQAADALQAAHNQGVIHLDVKPSNFLVQEAANSVGQLNLQLADFGVSKFATMGNMSHNVRGSYEYMAPENWKGAPVFATDQYALAVMAYKLLVDRPPFVGSGFEQMWHQHRFDLPPLPSSFNPAIPRAVDEVLLRALAKNPADRYSSVSAFADALHQAVSSSAYTQYPPMYQTLTLTSEEARAGTHRMVSLRNGQSIAVAVPPMAYEGQQIHMEARGAPPVIITFHVEAPVVPPPPRPIWKYVLFGGLALLLLLSALVGIFAFTSSQQNDTLMATATANANTAVAITGAIGTAQAKATASVQSTASTVASQYPFSTNKLFDDPLVDNTNGHSWNETLGGTGTCTFTGQGYVADEMDMHYFKSCVAKTTDLNNFTYQVQMTILKGDCGGIVFRADDGAGKYYLFQVCQDGHYELDLYVNNTGKALTSDYNSAINKGLNQTNMVAVVARGNSLTLYINNTSVDAVTDGTYSHGQIGVIAYAINLPTSVLYNDVEVWQL